ncbi:Protein tyrosine phosphatase type IVA 3, partial [Galemys pyrenaicus]
TRGQRPPLPDSHGICVGAGQAFGSFLSHGHAWAGSSVGRRSALCVQPWLPVPCAGSMSRTARPAPVEVSHKHMRFLIMHNPTDATLSSFLQGTRPRRDPTQPQPRSPRQDLKRYGATTVVRVCEVTYDKAPLEKDGITVVDWPFDDGAPPPGKVVEDWLGLLKAKFWDDPGSCVAVHCVAGLGRAPVLVALALIESGMKYEDAIQFIRQKRRGAINSKQLTYLEKYRPKQRLRFKEPHAHRAKCCVM